MLWEQMMENLKSWFIYSNTAWDMTLIGIGLGIAFGAFWLMGHWSPLFKNRWLLVVLVVSAFLTLLATVFIRDPIHIRLAEAVLNNLSRTEQYDWWALLVVPQLLASGLVQEGAKLVPMAFWWWCKDRNITPRLGMAIGAVAGAGFGIFEAVWINLKIFGLGWTWQVVGSEGFIAIYPFWERFFAVGLHVAVSALVGYGLAKGKGWQFYLMAVALHLLFKYASAFYQRGDITALQLGLYVAVFAVILTAFVVWLHWRKAREEEAVEEETVEIDI